MNDQVFLTWALPILFVLSALKVRKEMSIWLAIAGIAGAIVAQQDPQVWEFLLFCCAANTLSLFIAFKHWRSTHLDVAFYMGLLYGVEVIASFIHLSSYVATDSLSSSMGLITWLVCVIQLVLVSTMNDKKGELCAMCRDFCLVFVRLFQRFSSS